MGATAERLVFGYAVVLLVVVGVAFMTAADDSERYTLIVPGLCALLATVVAAVASAQERWPGAKQLALRLAATLPLIIAAALAMRAIRLDSVIQDQERVELEWRQDVARGRAAPGETGRDVYFRIRGLPSTRYDGVLRLLWGLVGFSAVMFGVLQFLRFRDRAG